MKSYWSRPALQNGSLVQYGLCPFKGGNLDTDIHAEKMPCADEGRDKRNVSISQGMPKTVSSPAEAKGEAGTNSTSQPSEGTHPANIFILGF